MNNQNIEYTMYIFVNDELKMSKGKIASQTGHVVQKIMENILESHNKLDTKKEKDIYARYIKWKNSGCKKIILKAIKTDLINLQQESESISIYDAGKTQIEPNSLTCIGFYPSCNNHDKFKNFKLL